jgi:GNAT superfamily N-acetyltransferase
LTFTETPSLTLEQQRDILSLWNSEYPFTLYLPDISFLQEYLASLTNSNHILVSDCEGSIKGWLTTFDKADERWFVIIIGKELQRQGIGKKLLDISKCAAPELHGWVIDGDEFIKDNGEPYQSPLNFYLKNGFRTIPEIRLETVALSAIKIKWSS